MRDLECTQRANTHAATIWAQLVGCASWCSPVPATNAHTAPVMVVTQNPSCYTLCTHNMLTHPRHLLGGKAVFQTTSTTPARRATPPPDYRLEHFALCLVTPVCVLSPTCITLIHTRVRAAPRRQQPGAGDCVQPNRPGGHPRRPPQAHHLLRGQLHCWATGPGAGAGGAWLYKGGRAVQNSTGLCVWGGRRAVCLRR